MAVGFFDSFPTVTTPNSPELFAVGIIAFIGLPFVSRIINIICMRFYALDKKGMEQVQSSLSEKRGAREANE